MRGIMVAVVSALLLAPVATTQDKDAKKTFEAALEAQYPISKQAKFEMNQVTQPGVVLVIRTDNIQAEPVHNFGSFVSKVKDGAVAAPGGAGGFFSRSNTRVLKAGEKVYVTDISVKDEAIQMILLTFDTYDTIDKGKTKPTRMRAVLQFLASKQDLATMDIAAAKKLIDPVLGTESDVAAANTKTVELGQSIAQVEKILGKPESIAKLGAKTIYTYKSMKVIFMDGKVSDVQ